MPPRATLAPPRPGREGSGPSHPSRIGGSGARPLSDAQIDGDWKGEGEKGRCEERMVRRFFFFLLNGGGEVEKGVFVAGGFGVFKRLEWPK